MIVLVVIVVTLVEIIEGVGRRLTGSSENLGTLTLHKNYQGITRRGSTKTEKHRREHGNVPPHSEFGLCGKNVRSERNGSRG